MNQPRRLGKGLAALLGEDPDLGPELEDQGTPALRIHHPADENDNLPETQIPGDFMLAVDQIVENPFQPRRDFGEAEIASLAESLREHDMLQPVLVRRCGDKWQLISGERRLRAAVRAGWKKVPVRVREADDRLVAELAIVENLQRKDLNAIEKALSFQRYLREHQCTQEDLGRRIKVDRSTIANLMRLLELPESVQAAVRDGRLSAGHARALLPLGDPRLQQEFCEKVLREQLSVRAIEQMVQDHVAEEDARQGRPPRVPPRRRTRAPHLASLEQELRQLLGMKVEIRTTSSDRGRLVIHFRNTDEFTQLRQWLTDGATFGRPQ